jgi:hypothetical protein
MYIKAKLQDCTSILMVEAVALALASTITARINLTETNFLSDCEQLVHFLNKEDLTNPPEWTIKPLTQMFANHAHSSGAKIYKIHRSLNNTTHSLARQALQALESQEEVHFTCSSEHHVP